MATAAATSSRGRSSPTCANRLAIRFSGLTAYYELLPASIGGKWQSPGACLGTGRHCELFRCRATCPWPAAGASQPDEEDREVSNRDRLRRLWQRRFGADPSIAGKTVRLSGPMFTIVGVAPQHFRGLDFVLDCAFWVPLGNIDRLLPKTSNYTSRFAHWIEVVGRLRPGASASTTGRVRNSRCLLPTSSPRCSSGIGKRRRIPFGTGGLAASARQGDAPTISWPGSRR